VSPDGPPLPGAAVTFGSPRWRLPSIISTSMTVAEDGRPLVLLVTGDAQQLAAIDPATGEVVLGPEMPVTASSLGNLTSGRTVIAGKPEKGSDVTAYLWDAASAAATPILDGDGRPIGGGLPAVDTFGDEMLVYDEDAKALRVVDLVTSETNAQLDEIEPQRAHGSLLPGDRLLLRAPYEVVDRRRQLWPPDTDLEVIDRRTQKVQSRLPTSTVEVFSPDRRQVTFEAREPVERAAAGEAGEVADLLERPVDIVVWDLQRGVERCRLPLDASMADIVWHPNGGFVTTDFGANIVRWDSSCRRIGQVDLGGGVGRLVPIALVSDTKLAGVNGNGVVYVVDLEDFAATSPGPGHTTAATTIAVSGDHVASADYGDQLHFWDIASGAEIGVEPDLIEDVVPSATRDAFDVLTYSTIETWTADGGHTIRVELPADVRPKHLSVDPTGGYLIAASDRHWRIDSAGRVSAPIPHLARDHDWNLALAGGTIAVPGRHVVQVNGGIELPARDCARIEAVAVTADGQRIVVADSAPTLSVWSIDGRLLAAIESPSTRFSTSVALAGDLVVVDRSAGGVVLWDLSRDVVVELPMDGLRLSGFVVTEDGWLAADGGAQTRYRIGLWDLVALQAKHDAIPARSVSVTAADKPCSNTW